MSRRQDLMVAVALLLFGLISRFYRLGAWSPGYDEPATLIEVASLFGTVDAAPASQTHRLPRMIPLGFALQWLGYQTFGQSVYAARIVPAILSALCIPIAYVGLRAARIGWISAVAAAFFLATWHRHLFYAQLNRFYAAAFLVVLCALLATLIAFAHRSHRWFVVALAMSVLALFTHAVQGIVLLVPLAGLAAMTAADRKVEPHFVIAALVATGVIGVVFLGHTLPLASGWNRAATPTSPVRVLVHTIPDLGIHCFPLAALGLGSEWTRSRRAVWIWVAALAALGLVLAVVPAVVPFRNAYGFPLLAAVLLLSGLGGGLLVQRMAETSRGMAWGVVFLLVALQTPAFVSYYRDGSRYNHRAAAEHIRANRQPHESIFAHYPTYWRFEYPDIRVQTLLERSGQPKLADHLKTSTTATWIALSYGRPGLPSATQAVLARYRCVETFEARKRRFDYYLHQIRVFRCPGLK